MKKFSILLTGLFLLSTSHASEWADDGQPVNGQGGGTPVSDLVYGSYADAVGDTFGQFGIYDITNFSAYRQNGTIELTIDYLTNNNNPTKGQPTSGIVGFIDIDADANNATGIQPQYNFFCGPPLDMGMDYYISFGSDVGGPQKNTEQKGTPVPTAELYDENDALIAQLTANFSADQVVIELPMNLIGNPVNEVYFDTIVGDFFEPTDCAPDAAILVSAVRGTPTATSVPTLNTLALFLMMSVLLVVGIRARKVQ